MLDVEHYLFDFETLGVRERSIVLSAAITPFTFGEKDTYMGLVNNSHYFKFDQESQFDRTYDQAAIEFWKRQPKELMQSQLGKSDQDITLKEFVAKLEELFSEDGEFNYTKNSCFFCRGTDFDFNLMKYIVSDVDGNMDRHGMFPIPFWNARDVRSFISGMMLNPNITKGVVEKPIEFIAHDPRHDNAMAIFEMKSIFRELYVGD